MFGMHSLCVKIPSARHASHIPCSCRLFTFGIWGSHCPPAEVTTIFISAAGGHPIPLAPGWKIAAKGRQSTQTGADARAQRPVENIESERATCRR